MVGFYGFIEKNIHVFAGCFGGVGWLHVVLFQGNKPTFDHQQLGLKGPRCEKRSRPGHPYFLLKWWLVILTMFG